MFEVAIIISALVNPPGGDIFYSTRKFPTMEACEQYRATDSYKKYLANFKEMVHQQEFAEKAIITDKCTKK